MLKNAPTLAIVAVHAEENEPLKFWGDLLILFNRCRIDLLPAVRMRRDQPGHAREELGLRQLAGPARIDELEQHLEIHVRVEAHALVERFDTVKFLFKILQKSLFVQHFYRILHRF